MMKKIRYRVFIKTTLSLLLAFFALLYPAQILAESLLTIDKAIQMTFQNNLDLKEKQAEVGIAKGEKQKLSAILPSSPQINLQYQTDKPFANEGQKGVQVSLSQEIEIGGQQFLRHKVGKLQLQKSQKDFGRYNQFISNQVKKLFYKTIYLQQKKSALQLLSTTSQSFSGNAKKRAQDNTITSFESDLWQLENANVTLELNVTNSELKEARLNLAKLLGTTEDELGIPTGVFPYLKNIPSESELLNLAQNQRLDLQKLNLEVLQKGKSYALAKRSLIPNPQLSLGYAQDTAIISGTDFNGANAITSNLGDAKQTDKFLQMGVSINIPIFSGYRGELTKSKHEKQLAVFQKQNFEKQIEVEVKSLRQRLVNIKNVIGQFQGYAGNIDRNLKQLSQAYQNGSVDYNNFLTNRDRLIKAKLQYLDARWTLAETQLDLDLATGESKGVKP